MCNFASFVLTKDRALWSSSSDSHEQIIAEHQLRDDAARVMIVRVELTPPEDDPRCADLARWAFCVDQDVLPEWTFQGDPLLEQRTREAAARRAEVERWWVSEEGSSPVVGYAGTATAGDAGTATAGYAGTATAGYRGTATAGDAGTATAGDRGTATAGDRGTATAGYAGTATAGYRGTATAGDEGTATAGDAGTATAGYAGTATAGYAGTATAGYRGTATAGDAGTATAGDEGTATAGDAGTATAGDAGIITCRYWDDAANRWRLAIGYVGEDGILPGVPYCVRAGRLVRRDGAP